MEGRERGRTLVVANRKGGTGKTTTVVNLGAELAGRGYRVLVVDLDPQGHAGLGFGILAKAGDANVHALLRDSRCGVRAAIRPTRDDNLDVLPADRQFEETSFRIETRRLAQLLEPLRASYDIILIDTPPAGASLLVCALAAAQGVLVPTVLEHLSFDGVRQFCHIYDHVVMVLRTALLGLVVVPTRVDFRNKAQKTVMSRLIQGFGLAQVVSGVRIDVSVSEAFEHHLPLRSYRSRARAVQDYGLVADDVIRRFACPERAALQPA